MSQLKQTNQKIQFHSYWKSVIFKFVKGCTYIGFEQYKDKYFLKIRIKDTKQMVFKLAGTPDDMSAETYQNLLKTITNEV